MRRWIVSIVAFPAILSAQIDSTLAKARATVLSEPARAEVYLDSVFVGLTPASFEVLPGSYEMWVAFPSIRDWNAVIHRESLQIGPGDTITSSVELGSVMTLNSRPSGADVLHDGQVIGTTPLFFQSAVSLRTALLLRKEGYEDLPVTGEPDGHLHTLKPMGNVEVLSLTEHERGSGRHWTTYASAIGIVASGVAAAYFKHQANKHFDRYAVTQNPSDLSSTRRFDGYSGVSLAVTQISFALLTFLLLSE